MSNLPYTFLEGMTVKHFLYLSKLAARMVTSTSSENLFYQRYERQNQNFDFETTKTLILRAWSIFFKGAHLTKLWSKKIFSMKTLSKLGALTVTLFTTDAKGCLTATKEYEKHIYCKNVTFVSIYCLFYIYCCSC
jgi:hypothetical protein